MVFVGTVFCVCAIAVSVSVVFVAIFVCLAIVVDDDRITELVVTVVIVVLIGAVVFVPGVVERAKNPIINKINQVYSRVAGLKNICPQQFQKLQPCAKTKKYEDIVLKKCYESKKKLGC